MWQLKMNGVLILKFGNEIKNLPNWSMRILKLVSDSVMDQFDGLK